ERAERVGTRRGQQPPPADVRQRSIGVQTGSIFRKNPTKNTKKQAKWSKLRIINKIHYAKKHHFRQKKRFFCKKPATIQKDVVLLQPFSRK
ncbi:MAG: hypothetical protein IJK99_07715, partial [Bacteroidales bacterium]|nr:hypothetical protein [Bacteroidales bacterium]